MENQGEKRRLKQMATLGVRSSDSKRNKTKYGAYEICSGGYNGLAFASLYTEPLVHWL